MSDLKNSYFKHIKADFSAGLVVFLVALPLCLGIALASGAPPLSGIIAGVVGGVVVGFLSNSHVSVSGPAAGLTAIVLTAIMTLGSFPLFLTAVVIAGLLQLILGFLKAGSISNYFPNNVIEGMLAGIGVIIFLKQIPHAFGYDRDPEGDMSFSDGRGHNTFTDLMETFDYIQPGAIVITIVALLILIFWDKIPIVKDIKLVPAALVAVTAGVVLNEIFIRTGSSFAVDSKHLVDLPVTSSMADFKALITLPDFNGFVNPDVWVVAITIAIVASIETLLCIEAGDRMDVYKRYSSTNIELKAQGVGNLLSGFLGGLPMTSVVVRTTANIKSGARTKMSAVIHGVLLLISVLSIPFILNKIPLATLAAILLLIGYKLASPAKLKHFWDQGKYQFIPFIATLGAVVFTDLLKGVAIGMVISVIFVLRGNLKRAYYFRKESYQDGDIIHINLAEEVSFLNKAAIKLTIGHIPADSTVIIDASNSVYIAHDVLELIKEFKEIGGPERNIKVTLIGFKDVYNLENSEKKNGNVWVEDNISEGGHKQLIEELTTDNN
ncbi:MAG: SulP family inorganic anion transporter [Saprospiraceae bacterium]|nr:SulP family inorganic anion transporter [Saprospiraceae bacterium]